jgi:4-aminobutyrate aminotransferase-like enzyme/Ser/Thr protein kinase RdoA (MazF antagonist)
MERNPFLGLEHRRPEVSLEEAARLLREHWGREGVEGELGSHQDRNVRVRAEDGQYVLKIARHGISRVELEAENAAMAWLAERNLSFAVPRPIRSLDGQPIVSATTSDGETHDLRLVTFLDGAPLSEERFLGAAVLRAQGEMLAELVTALDGFDHPGLDRAFQWDLRYAAAVCEAFGPSASTPARRARMEAAISGAMAALEPVIPDLRVQAIHADVTDQNTLGIRDASGRPMPVGIIDFGDLSRSWLVGELAVTIAADAMFDLERPLEVGRALTRGFTSRLALNDAEMAAVWPLVVARAASVAISGDYQQALEPDNDYVGGSRDAEWAALDAVVAVPFALAEEALREAAGLGPVGRPMVKRSVARILDEMPVPMPIDLSTTSAALDGEAIGDPGAAVALVEAAEAVGCMAVGRWGEGRLVDTRLDSRVEVPTVHLGVDLFAPPGTPVHAPVGGRIRLVEGGLAIGGVDDLRLLGIVPAAEEGSEVAAGAVIGTVAASGPDGLPSHVHVQRVVVPGLDAPTRSVPSDASAWRRLCPDPGALLALDPDAVVAPPDDPAGLLARRDAVLATTQEHYFMAPPRIERGWRHHMVDTRGRAYVDIVNNVAVVGHSHPQVEAAVARQLRLLNTNSRFLYEPMVAFAEALVARFPDPLDTVFLVNTGSEANELAIRLARTATGHEDVIAIRGAYHGWTVATDAITTSLLDNPRALETRPAWVHPVEAPNAFRGRFRGPDAGPRYAEDVRAAIARMQEGGRAPAAFIAEALFGNAGGVVLPDGYLREAYAAVREAGGLAIADEVQVGYGRTGAFQWAYEQQGVVPDIVTVAKAAGNGMAVGAVITTRTIADAFGAQGSFFSSVGGSPVACAAGLAVLGVIDAEGLQRNALETGAYLKAGLERATAGHRLVGAVHGMGLYLGVELVRDPETQEPAAAEALAICERMLDLGVIVQPTGDGNNVLKVKPPLCITRDSADLVAESLEIALRGW